MNILQRSVRAMSKTKAVRWIAIRTLHPLDMRLRGTRFAPMEIMDAPLCYVTTTGRKSGEPREVPLLYTELDGAPVVVATNFAQEHHPAWSHNLDADPHARVDIDGETTDVVARRATADEMEIAWPAFASILPAYEQYRQTAPRDIKMYVLDPAPPS